MKFGISESQKQIFEDNFKYNIPELLFPYTIKMGTETIALIGSDISWINRRADLNVYLNKDVDESFIYYFMPIIINKYIEYLHNNNLYSISTSVCASDKVLLNTLLKSDMNYYAAIPYNSLWNGTLETTYLFEHYPDMQKNYNEKLPKNKSVKFQEGGIKKLSDKIYLKNGYIAVSPKYLTEVLNIDISKVVSGHVSALQQRKNFSIPLGEDKYFIQEGNGNYGISKMVKNFSYILLNEEFEYVGYCSILRREHRSCTIDIAIIPKYHGIGLGSLLLDAFYNELLDKGYMSVISNVFNFNSSSKKMHSKLANYVGTRSSSYYIGGDFCDMDIYVKSI